MSLKAVHYINQFYAGIGGETMADTGFGILEEKKGPALGLEQLWNGEMTISKVVYCGDNYVNTDENYGEVKEKLAKVIREEKPDVFIAGPAFNAGRYGVACAKVCDYVRSELGVPTPRDTCLPATAIMNIPISPAQNASWICSWRGCITRSLRQRCPSGALR